MNKKVGRYFSEQRRSQWLHTMATDIFFGNLLGASTGQIILLILVGSIFLVAKLIIYRPLLLASIDPEVVLAKGRMSATA